MEFVTGIIFLTFVFTQGAELPPSFKICKQNDPNLEKCFAEAATRAIQLMGPGIKSLRSLPIDPLSIDRVTMGGDKGPFSLKQEYQNCKLVGLSKGLKISNYKVDLQNLIFSSESFNPQVDFIADYKLDGNILIFPIRGHGRSNITMLNLKTQNTFYGEKFQKDGEIYMGVKKYDVKFTPEKVLMNFENLFDGDKTRGAQMNSILNQNADTLFKELKIPYEKTFGLVFTKMANAVITKVPFNKILPVS